jgi:exopolysaccharide biosynthesis polyprenyl glycosylphosphotransferase
MARVRRWALAGADATAVAAAIAFTAEVGRVDSSNWIWAALAIPVWILVAKINSLYDQDHRRISHTTTEEIPALVATSAISMLIVKLISELLTSAELPSSALITIGIVAVVLAILLRVLVRRLYLVVAERERTVLIGSGRKATMVFGRLQRRASDTIELVGFIASEQPDPDEAPGISKLAYLGNTGELGLAVREQRVSRVVIADDELNSRQVGEIITVCRQAEASITLVPANHEVLGPNTELNRIGAVPMLDFHFSVPPRSTMFIKRVIDIFFSAVFLAFASPVLLVSALMIKIDSPGPVFFRQVRVGKDGRRFTMLKLRTMRADAESELEDLIDLDSLVEPSFKIKDDPRVTRVGAALRRMSIDEIPQFINVLRGDMSLVGPRPEEEAVVALYDERQRQRLVVKPGLTGPMQVAGRGELGFEERLSLDRDYVDNLTITGDIRILIRTPRAVIRGDGAF